MKIDFSKVWKKIVDHSGTICAVTGVAGVAVTAYFSGKAAVEVKETVKPQMTGKEKFKAYVKAYWKTMLSFIVTSGLIVGSDRIHVHKELGLAGLAVLYKDKFVEIEKKMREKFGDEVIDEVKEEMKKDAVVSKANFDMDDLGLSSEEMIVYVGAADEYFITTEKRLFYAFFEANEKMRTMNCVSLGYFCKKLGHPVSGYRDPKLDYIFWDLDNAELWYEWQTLGGTLGGSWIDYVRNVYLDYDEISKGPVTPISYKRADDYERNSKDIMAINFVVEPI